MICKIYNDGSSFIAQPIFKSKQAKKIERASFSTADVMFDRFYKTIDFSLPIEDQKKYIVSLLAEEFPNSLRLIEDYVERKFKDKIRNLNARKKRFLRKVNLVNKDEYILYFVTFTYDSSKISEEKFEKKLRKSLSNFHSRRGWLYALGDERGELGERLHFHGVCFVPHGQMVGNIIPKSHFSKKEGKVVTYFENSFFAKKFGVNDFVLLSGNNNEIKNRVNYVLKYIGKSDAKIIYSRGFPTYLVKDIDEFECFCEFFDYVLKYILFDDFIYNPDCIVRENFVDDLSEFVT